ncbi:MAG: esterase family protein [Kurthia sp.]|nr:esterase family protein [Candidatus Kurthia equi]
MDKGSIMTTTLFSEALQEEMKLLIYVPASYTPMIEYPIAIASDGNDYFQLGSLSRILDEKIEEGDIEEHIVVGIPYINSQDRRQKYMPDGEKHQAYLTFLAEELMCYLNEHYSISQLPSDHILMGDSQAATVSLLALVKYPEVFQQAILHSPQVNEQVLSLAQNLPEDIQFHIYHAIGKGETEVQTRDGQIKDFLTPNRQLHEVLQDFGIDYEYAELPGDHTWKTWKPDLPRAIVRIFQN